MKALIILAHGSRHKDYVKEIDMLTEKTRNIVKQKYNIVEYAFLELIKPSLITIIDKLILKKVVDITILPYFLNTGKHLSTDIPAIIDSVSKNHKNCNFKLTPCIGKLENMPELIVKQSLNY